MHDLADELSFLPYSMTIQWMEYMGKTVDEAVAAWARDKHKPWVIRRYAHIKLFLLVLGGVICSMCLSKSHHPCGLKINAIQILAEVLLLLLVERVHQPMPADHEGAAP
jgi:hypothetical protein